MLHAVTHDGLSGVRRLGLCGEQRPGIGRSDVNSMMRRLCIGVVQAIATAAAWSVRRRRNALLAATVNDAMAPQQHSTNRAVRFQPPADLDRHVLPPDSEGLSWAPTRRSRCAAWGRLLSSAQVGCVGHLSPAARRSRWREQHPLGSPPARVPPGVQRHRSTARQADDRAPQRRVRVGTGTASGGQAKALHDIHQTMSPEVMSSALRTIRRKSGLPLPSSCPSGVEREP